MAAGSAEFAPSLHENSSTNLLSDRESPVSGTGNQYEVPYCYSVRTLDSTQYKHAGGSIAPPASDRYPFRQYPYFQYLSDYEAY